MSTHDKLLAAVIAQPEDDDARLIYADFLDEWGGESNADRAEFIRLQIERSRLSKRDSKRIPLIHREKELLSRWSWEWAAPLHEYVYEWVFRRGFIEKVAANLERSGEEIREILTLAPIRAIRDESQLDDLSGIVEALPAMAKLHGLEFWGWYAFQDEQAREMLTSPHLANLKKLIIFHDRNGNLVDDGVIIEALHSPYRSNLKYLGVNIDDTWRGPSGAVIRAMMESPYLRNVQKLKLSHTRLDPELVSKLFRNMPQLNRLDLHECVATSAAWSMILERAQTGRFKWLRLCEARISSHATASDTDYGNDLSDNAELVEAFNATRAHIDWNTDFIMPFVGGCWRGHTWEDLHRQQQQHFDRFLRARDYDGMEAYYRELCTTHRGRKLAAQIEKHEIEPFRRELAKTLREIEIPAQATSLQAPIRGSLYALTDPVECIYWNWSVGDEFIPREQRFDGDVVGRFEGPVCPGAEPNIGGRAHDNPFDPRSGELYMHARRIAAVARAAQDAAFPLPVIAGPHYHRVW